jgi:hypothetical protein
VAGGLAAWPGAGTGPEREEARSSRLVRLTETPVMGAWELLEESSEVAAVHAALLPNGEVVYYSGNTGPEIPADTRIWNPVQRMVRAAPNAPDTDLFCNGLTMLWDGRLFVVGGTAKYSEGPGDPWFGSNAAYRFDPFVGWERIEDMAFGRWYPTALALPDGRVLVVGGEGGAEVNGARTEQAEVYDPLGGWTVLPDSANRFLPLYPRLHVLASGEILCAGQGAATAILNLDTLEWREIAPAEPAPMGGGSGPARQPKRSRAARPKAAPRGARGRKTAAARARHGEHPTPAPPPHIHDHRPGSVGPRPDDLSVLVGPAQAMKVLNAGGGDPATANARIMDLSEDAPAWREIAPMHHGRWFPNSVVLPDGTLFVAGGGLIYNAEPVMEAEIFDPVSEAWILDAPMSVPRLYHSTAVLLPDGRVWMAGTDGETRMELYSPDYLFAGPRPILFAAPASVTYGQQFPIPMADPDDVADACFIRLSAVTHAVNMGQRYVPLDVAVTGPNELEVTAPGDPFLAPPGHYLLFIRNHAGVPAEAPIILLVVT